MKEAYYADQDIGRFLHESESTTLWTASSWQLCVGCRLWLVFLFVAKLQHYLLLIFGYDLVCGKHQVLANFLHIET